MTSAHIAWGFLAAVIIISLYIINSDYPPA